ncbi:hypothetical protein J6T21_04420 [Candidatus Saccharibacteria bacterium]|nr:hypothetical protein [Candidatus Saccharibacteria bacterium]
MEANSEKMIPLGCFHWLESSAILDKLEAILSHDDFETIRRICENKEIGARLYFLPEEFAFDYEFYYQHKLYELKDVFDHYFDLDYPPVYTFALLPNPFCVETKRDDYGSYFLASNSPSYDYSPNYSDLEYADISRMCDRSLERYSHIYIHPLAEYGFGGIGGYAYRVTAMMLSSLAAMSSSLYSPFNDYSELMTIPTFMGVWSLHASNKFGISNFREGWEKYNNAYKTYEKGFLGEVLTRCCRRITNASSDEEIGKALGVLKSQIRGLKLFELCKNDNKILDHIFKVLSGGCLKVGKLFELFPVDSFKLSECEFMREVLV